MELLIIAVDWTGKIRLKDCSNHHIAYFNTVPEAEDWCRDNGYRWRVEK